MQVKKQQLELDTEQQNGSKSGKEYVKAIYCHTAYLTFLQVKYVKCQPGWSTGNQDGGRNINNLRYADDTTFMAESKEKLKSFLSWKEGSEIVGLKLNTQKTNIMASGPITSWQIDGETVETVTDFIFLGSKITEDYNCSHEIKRCLLLGRKAMTNLDGILKNRDIFANKGSSSQSCGFSSSHIWMWNLDCKESWAWKNYAFELWCWRRLLRVPWTAKDPTSPS